MSIARDGPVMPMVSGAALLDFLDDDDFSNLFVHDVQSARDIPTLRRLYPEMLYFDQRALLLAGPRDVVCLLERPEEAYLDYLAGLGLRVAAERVVTPRELGSPVATGPLLERLLGSPTAIEELSKRLDPARRIRLQPFIAAEREFALAAALERAAGRDVQLPGGDPRGIDLANQKHRVREKAQELGIPVAPGEIVELAAGAGESPPDLGPLEAAVERQLARTGRVIVRGTRGYSGSSTHVIEANRSSRERALAALAKRRDNRIYLVDALLPLRLSPNVQTLIEPESGAIHCLAITDQRLSSALVHRGNSLPSQAANASALWEHALALSRWLRDEGCSGVVGFDFCEVDAPGPAPGHFLVEINARTNGATYPLALFERLARQLRRERRDAPAAFVSQAVKTRLRSFAQIERALADSLLEAGSASGVVPYNIGALRAGNVSLAAFAADRDTAAGLCRRAESRIR